MKSSDVVGLIMSNKYGFDSTILHLYAYPSRPTYDIVSAAVCDDQSRKIRDLLACETIR
jgi:hypothetical protein